MNYKISSIFQKEVNSIVDYIADNFGKKYALEFIDEIQRNILHIVKYPEASAAEPLLEGRQTTFRSKIVSKHNKAIYYIKGETIYFVDLWDMRRHPDKLIRRIKKNNSR